MDAKTDFSKSHTGEGGFGHSRRTSDFNGKVTNRRGPMMPRTGGFGGMSSRTGQSKQWMNRESGRDFSNSFKSNTYPMPPPGGNFAAYKNPFSSGPTDMTPMKSTDSNATAGTNNNDSKPSHRRSPPFNLVKEERRADDGKSDSTGAVSANDSRGGFGRGRRGPPNATKQEATFSDVITLSKTPANVHDSVVSPTVPAAVDRSLNSPAPRSNISRHRQSSVRVDKDEKPRDIADSHKGKADMKSNDKSYAATANFGPRLHIGNYDVGITFKDGAPFSNIVPKVWHGIDAEMKNHLIKKMRYERPLVLQSLLISMVNSGRDVVFQSPAGSGKMTAVILSILKVLSTDPVGRALIMTEDKVVKPNGVIIAPTAKVPKDVRDRCLQIIGDLNFCVGITISASENTKRLGFECDILCTNVDDLKYYNDNQLISFEKLKVIAVVEAERMEESYLNLIRYIKKISDLSDASVKENRRTIVSGTCISATVYGLSEFLLKPNYFFLHLKRLQQNKADSYRYSKDDLLMMNEVTVPESKTQIDDVTVSTEQENPKAMEDESPKTVDKESKNTVDEESPKTVDEQSPNAVDEDVSKENEKIDSEANEKTEVESPAVEVIETDKTSDTVDSEKSATSLVDKDVPEEAAAIQDDYSQIETDAEVSMKQDNEPVKVVPTKQDTLKSVAALTSDATVIDSVSNNKDPLTIDKIGITSVGNLAGPQSSSSFSKSDLENLFRDVKKQIELETLKARNELISAENARLSKRVVVLEQQLASVMKFFGNFLANNAAVTGVSTAMSSDLVPRSQDQDY